MDIYCPRCGEPWDRLSLNPSYGDMTEQESRDFQDGKGCPCCINKPLSELSPEGIERGYYTGALMDVLGDDLDGLAATLEDFGI
jgi:hypothetical protein